jgi:hypothetical protein
VLLLLKKRRRRSSGSGALFILFFFHFLFFKPSLLQKAPRRIIIPKICSKTWHFLGGVGWGGVVGWDVRGGTHTTYALSVVGAVEAVNAADRYTVNNIRQRELDREI